MVSMAFALPMPPRTGENMSRDEISAATQWSTHAAWIQDVSCKALRQAIRAMILKAFQAKLHFKR